RPSSSPLFPYTTLFRSTELICDGDRVVGAVVVRDGTPVRVRARRGVLLAAGGFERNADMRARYGVPGDATDTMGAPGNTGAAHLDRKSTRLNSSHVKIS